MREELGLRTREKPASASSIPRRLTLRREINRGDNDGCEGSDKDDGYLG